MLLFSQNAHLAVIKNRKGKIIMEEVKYYRHAVGEVVVRQTGDLIERKKKGGKWTKAPQLLRRIQFGDTELIEITEEEAKALVGD